MSLIETEENRRLLTAIAVVKYNLAESIEEFDKLNPVTKMGHWLYVEAEERARFEAEFPKAPAKELWHE